MLGNEVTRAWMQTSGKEAREEQVEQRAHAEGAYQDIIEYNLRN
jgi:hypothetical protein